MKTLMTTLALLLVLCTNTFATSRNQMAITSADTTTYKLTVVLSNVNDRTGKIYIGLATSEANFNGESVKKLVVDVPATGEISVTFDGLAPGRYAVRLFQDLNGNQKMDYSGQMPNEPFGFSNVTRLMGPPSFDQSSFELEGNKTIQVGLMSM